jgi:hypothetical protein
MNPCQLVFVEVPTTTSPITNLRFLDENTSVLNKAKSRSLCQRLTL